MSDNETFDPSKTCKVLHDIQQKLHVPKGQRNNFGNYNYRSCEDIVEAVKKILPENFSVTFNDELVLVGDRYYVKATCVLMSNNADVLTRTAWAREPLNKKGMDEAQITGATSSYARKYAANAMFLIDDTKDADHDSQSVSRETKPAPYKKETKQEAPKDIPVQTTDPKGQLFKQIEDLIKNKKLSIKKVKAIKDGINKARYPVSWEMTELMKLKASLEGIKVAKQPF